MGANLALIMQMLTVLVCYGTGAMYDVYQEHYQRQ